MKDNEISLLMGTTTKRVGIPPQYERALLKAFSYYPYDVL